MSLLCADSSYLLGKQDRTPSNLGPIDHFMSQKCASELGLCSYNSLSCLSRQNGFPGKCFGRFRCAASCLAGLQQLRKGVGLMFFIEKKKNRLWSRDCGWVGVEGLGWVDTKVCVVFCCALVVRMTNTGDGMLEWL
jgi:hypothetical protein